MLDKTNPNYIFKIQILHKYNFKSPRQGLNSYHPSPNQKKVVSYGRKWIPVEAEIIKTRMTTSFSSEAQKKYGLSNGLCKCLLFKKKEENELSKRTVLRMIKNHETFIINTFCCMSHRLADKVSCILDAIWKMKPSQSKFSIYFNIRRKNHKYENADNKNQRSSFNSSWINIISPMAFRTDRQTYP